MSMALALLTGDGVLLAADGLISSTPDATGVIPIFTEPKIWWIPGQRVAVFVQGGPLSRFDAYGLTLEPPKQSSSDGWDLEAGLADLSSRMMIDQQAGFAELERTHPAYAAKASRDVIRAPSLMAIAWTGRSPVIAQVRAGQVEKLTTGPGLEAMGAWALGTDALARADWNKAKTMATAVPFVRDLMSRYLADYEASSVRAERMAEGVPPVIGLPVQLAVITKHKAWQESSG